MSVWTTPITFSNGVLTAAAMNAEVRDHFNWTKGFADLVTNATAADTGTSTFLQIRRTATTNAAYEAQVGAEANPRLRIRADGRISWGAGGASAVDLYIERSTATYLLTNAGIIYEYASGGAVALEARTTGDVAGRVTVGKDTGNFGYVAFASDGITQDARIRSTSPGTILLDNPDDDTVGVALRSTSADPDAIHAFGFMRTGDAFPKVAVGQAAAGQGAIMFGSGDSSPTALYFGWSAAGRIQCSGMLNAGNGIATRVNAGAFSNVVWESGPLGATPVDGMLGIDSANGRLWMRYGGTHHYITQTAGMLVPDWELSCPQCGVDMKLGDRIVSRLESVQEDGALHGLYEHETCPKAE